MADVLKRLRWQYTGAFFVCAFMKPSCSRLKTIDAGRGGMK